MQHTTQTIESNPGKIYLIDKPLNFTSADIVRIFKRELNLKKVGHSGTLDPKATGLLILCSDKMTKKINDFIEYDKEYEGRSNYRKVKNFVKTKYSIDDELTEEEMIEFGDEAIFINPYCIQCGAQIDVKIDNFTFYQAEKGKHFLYCEKCNSPYEPLK